MASNTPTPATTLQAATDENALPANRLVLLGTYLRASKSTALIRTASGRIRSVKRGDRLGNGKVIAIEDGRLSISKSGKSVMLKMPKD